MYQRAYVEITNICNMNCSFCHGHSRPRKQMSREEFSHILSQLKGHTEYIYYHLMGEPLTHPLLPEFISMAKEKGFHSIITTNGTLLKKRGLELLEAGAEKVSISLHSFEEDDEAGYRSYLQQVAEFADTATKNGMIVNFRLWNKGVDEGRNQIAIAFLQSYFSDPWTENTRGYRLRDKLFLEWGDRFIWPDRNNPENDAKLTCYGLRSQFGILCDGTVVPCCLDSEGVINLGNAFIQDLGEILNSPRAQAIAEGFRNHKAAEDLCRRCPYAQKFK